MNFKQFFLIFAFFPLLAGAKTTQPVYKYEKSPYVSEDVWQRVQPYLLPSNMPIKKKLDEIFSKSRITANVDTVRKAGFIKYKQREFSHCTVSPHPFLNGYFVKMYTDDVSDVVDYHEWILRIEGAKGIQATIDGHGYGKLFKVPKKWIYPLPPKPEAAPGSYRKNFILIAEDMNIHRTERNKSKWKSSLMNKPRMDAMYVILQENGLSDCIYPFNIPFCKDDKQAFIDTEHNHVWPVHFERMYFYFAPKKAEYWHQLVVQDGPK